MQRKAFSTYKREYPMIDKVKRTTLKRIGLTAATVAAGGIASHSMANPANGWAKSQTMGETLPLADIHVSTRVSSITNDLEVLIKNVGDTNTTITQMTPSVTVTKRGQFDFGQLFNEGDVFLSPGQSVSVPMQRHAVSVNATDTATGQARSLTDALRRSFSVVTDNDAFAKVEVSEGLQFV